MTGPTPLAETMSAALIDAFVRTTPGFVAQFAERFGSCWGLYVLGEELQKVDVDDVVHEEADVVLWGTAARGTKTYRAVLYLCSLGHGPQATMLNRSLFEDALTARWTELNREEAMSRIDAQEKHNRHLWTETFKNRELDLGSLGDLPPLSAEDLDQLERDFGPYGTRPWTGHVNLRQLVEELDPVWGDENERLLLDWMQSVHLRHANLTVHNTASSVVKPRFTDDRPIYDAEAGDEDIAVALLMGFWAYGNLFRVVLRGEQRGRFEAFYTERLPTLLKP